MHPIALRSELLTRAGFVHGFSTRWASPDGAEGPSPSGDDHLRGFLAALGRDVASALRVKQVHGATVLRAIVPDWGAEADAIVLGPAEAAATPVIRTADCVPIVLADPRSGRVGAVHAGWRGVEKRILAEAVAAIDAPAERLLAAVGPCLCAACFEVGEEVVEALVPVSGAGIVDRGRGPKPHVDLRLAVRLQLRALGLDDAHVEDVTGCTRCEPERFFSYRRDGANAGRQMAVIVARAAAD
jgi:hypothetical protein